MALPKDPSRRYASADRLSGDIERYLHGFPVEARGDSFAYVAGKFVRRNRAWGCRAKNPIQVHPDNPWAQRLARK